MVAVCRVNEPFYTPLEVEFTAPGCIGRSCRGVEDWDTTRCPRAQTRSAKSISSLPWLSRFRRASRSNPRSPATSLRKVGTDRQGHSRTGSNVLGHSAPRHLFGRIVHMADGVWLVVGVQAAGKSTVADLLARQFERGVHVRGGQFSRWSVTGWTNPWDEDQERARKLLDLRYRLSALVATEYCRTGFGTVVQDNIFGEDVRTWLRAVSERPRHLVVLRPTVAAVLERDYAPQRERGKVAYRSGETDPLQLDALFATTPRIGLWLDSSAQTPLETIQCISGSTD